MYRKFYGLNGKPFQLTPDLKFLYPSDGHKRAMAYLRYGLEQGEGFVVVAGDIGTGKTLLIQTLLAELADQRVATARIASANLEANRVPAAVAAALGQPFEGKSKEAILANLEKSLIHARDQLDGVLLIVDEAQTLSDDALEELRILSNLEFGGQALLQVILVGQTELKRTLWRRRLQQLRQRIVVSYNLEPLSFEETKRYIGFRLVAVGWNGDPSLSPEVYETLYEFTGGVPRKINLVMDRLLVYGFLEEIHEFHQADIDAIMAEMSEELSGDLGTAPEPELPDEPMPDALGSQSQAAAPRSRGSALLETRLRALEAKLEKLSTQPRAGSR